MEAAIRDLVDSRATAELRVYLLSDELITHDIDSRLRESTVALGLILLVLDGLCVWALFKSWREVLVVFGILAAACVWTFGAAGLFGLRFSFIHLISFSILLGTGIDNTFIFGRRMAEERAKGKAFPEALRATYEGVGTACFLTTCTTCFAFFISGVTTGTEVIVSFYLLVSSSMLIAFVLGTVLQGAVRAELLRYDTSGRVPGSTSARSFLDRGTQRLSDAACRLITRPPRAVFLVTGALFVLALGAGWRLRSEIVREHFLRRGMPTYAANSALTEHFGEARVGYVLFTGDVENPLLLEKMRRLQQRLASHPMIEQILGAANVESVVELVEKLRIPIGPTTAVRSVLDRITESDLTANFVLNMTYREAAGHLVHKTAGRYDGLIMRFFVREGAASRVQEACRAIERELRDLEFDRIPGVESRIGGGDITYSLESAYYSDTMVRSFLLSLLGTWVVLLLVWRRLWPSLLATVPVVLAVALIIGLMAVCGITLNAVTVAIGAPIVGLGIDYPIHIIERFEEERRGGAVDRTQAMQGALVTMGPHIMAGMLTTVAGFAASCVLSLPLAISFGLLTAAAIVFVYLGSIFVLPVLLLTFGADSGRRGKGRENDERNDFRRSAIIMAAGPSS